MMAMQELVSATFVGTAATEAEAVAWLGAHAVDWNLAVVDLFLAQGSGLGVVKACRTRQERQRVVVLTNYPNASVMRKASELGADAIFDKSCDLDAFFDFCGRHLRSLPA